MLDGKERTKSFLALFGSVQGCLAMLQGLKANV
jgi:hypothetical protein